MYTGKKKKGNTKEVNKKMYAIRVGNMLDN